MSLDHTALVTIGGQITITQLTDQIAAVVRTVPELRPYAVRAMAEALETRRALGKARPAPKKAPTSDGRARLAESLRRRWAAAKAAGQTSLRAPAPSPTPKRGRSPAGSGR